MNRPLFAFILALMFSADAVADDWPQWRGPNRTGISKETGLFKEWPSGGPALRWKVEDIGTGYSSPAIVKGCVYLQITRGKEEFAISLDENSGTQIWSVPIGKVGENRGPQYPGTRSTPTVDGDFIYCLASDGELVCLDGAAGKVKWERHLKNDFGGQAGKWAYSESVLVDGDVLICTPGGSKATLVALNKTTGDVIWESAVPGGDNAEYASIMVVDDDTVKQYVQFLRTGIVGVEAETGKFLWRYDRTAAGQAANILTPVVFANRVFSAGSRSGGGLVELKANSDGVTATEVYSDGALGASIGGAVLVDGYLYGTSRNAMFCAEFATGKVMWEQRALGAASICYADDRLYVRSHESGDVALVEPSTESYREKGRLKQPKRSSTRAWPHPVIANGGLYLRDQGVLLCYDTSGPQDSDND